MVARVVLQLPGRIDRIVPVVPVQVQLGRLADALVHVLPVRRHPLPDQRIVHLPVRHVHERDHDRRAALVGRDVVPVPVHLRVNQRPTVVVRERHQLAVARRIDVANLAVPALWKRSSRAFCATSPRGSYLYCPSPNFTIRSCALYSIGIVLPRYVSDSMLPLSSYRKPHGSWASTPTSCPSQSHVKFFTFVYVFTPTFRVYVRVCTMRPCRSCANSMRNTSIRWMVSVSCISRNRPLTVRMNVPVRSLTVVALICRSPPRITSNWPIVASRPVRSSYPNDCWGRFCPPMRPPIEASRKWSSYS
uniref:Uncharacterized protein n=1 Tax=Anopheles coluzzii TaxID=1518534 RepID=A0A8W7P524_ANOCL